MPSVIRLLKIADSRVIFVASNCLNYNRITDTYNQYNYGNNQ